MPIYCFECVRCQYEFEEYKHIRDSHKSGKCQKCGSIAYKIPAPFIFNKFKPRKFADGTETPSRSSTLKQEKMWLKNENIT